MSIKDKKIALMIKVDDEESTCDDHNIEGCEICTGYNLIVDVDEIASEHASFNAAMGQIYEESLLKKDHTRMLDVLYYWHFFLTKH